MSSGLATKPILLGGEDKWLYDPSSKKFDLSRGSSKTLNIDMDESREGVHKIVSIDPEKTAYVIVDMQNFFLDKSCREHPLGLAAVDPTLKVVEKCRKEGVKVVWLNWGLTDEDLQQMPPAVQRGFSRDLITGAKTGRNGLGTDMGDGKGRCLFAGSWNADIYSPLKTAAQDGDAQCAKNRMSGLWSPEQPLFRYLKSHEIKTCFFSGVNTDQCVLGTLTDAFSWGWDCIMIEDCAATTTGGGAAGVCTQNVANSYGFVVNSQEFAGATRS